MAFTYLRRKFIPVGKLPENFDFFNITEKCRRLDKPVNVYNDSGYSHKEFYDRAKKAGAADIDIFEMNGLTVLPCQNDLFEYHGRFVPKEIIKAAK